MKRRIRLTESGLHRIVKESITKVLNESASTLLYHFLSFYRFEKLVQNNSFTPTSFEKDWFNGKNSISFSRTKSFREGWPVIMYSGEDGKGEDWCAIRLTIDGDLINRKPNFKVDNKQYNMSIKPFDWAYKQYNDGDPYTFDDECDGIFANNGKEWMMQSDGYTSSYLPINYGKKSDKYGYASKICDKQGHPYSQAEDRLVTYANTIPNASQYILRVDILLLPYNFSEENLEERLSLYRIIKESQLSDKIHVYDKMRNLELGGYEIRDKMYVPYFKEYILTYHLKKLLSQKTARNYKGPVFNRVCSRIIKRDY